MIEGGERALGIVLRADGKQDAPLAQRPAIELEGLEGLAPRRALADHDPLDAVVADHPAPERVVEIEHQHLAGQAAHGGEDPRHLIAEPRPRRRAHMLLGMEPHEPVLQRVEPFGLGRGDRIEDQHPLLAGGADQPVLHLGHHGPARGGDQPVEMTEDRIGRRHRKLLDHRGAYRPKRAPAVDGLGQARLERRLHPHRAGWPAAVAARDPSRRSRSAPHRA